MKPAVSKPIFVGGSTAHMPAAASPNTRMGVRHPIADFYKYPGTYLSSTDPGPRQAREASGQPLPEELFARLEFLRLEGYCRLHRTDAGNPLATDALRRLYYLVRPLLPDAVRKAFQRVYLSDWRKLEFPSWPVDMTVEDELETGLLDIMRHSNVSEVPFIWFWPYGARGAVMITHDVETHRGLKFVPTLMDIDDDYGFKGAYQLVPEERYSVPTELLHAIHKRGCEANVHGLNHGVNLFENFSSYLIKVNRINQHIERFGSEGFRSPSMYRNVEWLKHLNIQYDMSVPNVAHLEPQRGGCCTVFPYFVGSILELPLTTIQDYSLLHILQICSTALWKEQVELILSKHGLASFIVHPDYLLQEPPLQLYRELLEWLREEKTARNLWVAKPSEVNRWWRMRDQMNLESRNGMWKITGAGAECASIAFATEREGGGIQYRISAKRRNSETIQ